MPLNPNMIMHSLFCPWCTAEGHHKPSGVGPIPSSKMCDRHIREVMEKEIEDINHFIGQLKADLKKPTNQEIEEFKWDGEK